MTGYSAPHSLIDRVPACGLRNSVLVAELYDSVQAVFDEWEALADRTGAPPFRRPGWVFLWEKHFSSAPVRVLGIRRDDRIVALLPIVPRAGVLRSPTNFHSPEFGALAEDSAAARCLFDNLFAQGHRQISLALLEDGGQDLRACLAAAATRGERTLMKIQQQSPFLDFHGEDWAGLENRLSAKLRGDLRRRARKLGEAGAVTFEVSDGRVNLDRLLDEGFQVEPSEWKTQRGTAITSRSDTRTFYQDVARWAADRHILRLAFLRLDGRPIAFQFGLEDGGVYYFLKGGYDVTYRQFAPGKLLVRSMLTRALEVGLRCFEFLGATESWKSEWTTTSRTKVAVSSFGTGPIGSTLWLANRFARPAAKQLLVRLRAWSTRGRTDQT